MPKTDKDIAFDLSAVSLSEGDSRRLSIHLQWRQTLALEIIAQALAKAEGGANITDILWEINQYMGGIANR